MSVDAVSVSSNHRVLSIGKSVALLTFGLAILFLVGFSPMNAAHNATHDSRHAFAFPCH